MRDFFLDYDNMLLNEHLTRNIHAKDYIKM